MKQQILTITSNVITLPVVRDGVAVGEVKLPVDDTLFLGNFYALLPKLSAHRETLAAALGTKTENPADTLVALDALWQSQRGPFSGYEAFQAPISASCQYGGDER